MVNYRMVKKEEEKEPGGYQNEKRNKRSDA
jgi:hypothetical protein